MALFSSFRIFVNIIKLKQLNSEWTVGFIWNRLHFLFLLVWFWRKLQENLLFKWTNACYAMQIPINWHNSVRFTMNNGTNNAIRFAQWFSKARHKNTHTHTLSLCFARAQDSFNDLKSVYDKNRRVTNSINKFVPTPHTNDVDGQAFRS